MTIGSLGKTLANQAIESTKNSVMDAVRTPAAPKPAEPKPAAAAPDPAVLAAARGGNVQLYSRNRLPQHLPDVAASVANLPVDDVVLEGARRMASYRRRVGRERDAPA